MRLTFFQYVVLTALTAQIVSAVELSASRAARDNTITNTAAASSHSTLRADEASLSNSESISDILTRALRADTVGLRSSNGIASYDEALGIPKCSSEGTSCDTGDLVNGRGPVYPSPTIQIHWVWIALMEQVVDHLMNLSIELLLALNRGDI